MKTLIVSLCFLIFPLTAFSQNVIFVAPAGGDFNNPVDALDAIGTVLPAPSASNRYLVKLAPGRYNVNDPVVMKPFVDLQGSGIKTTLIRGAVDSSFGGPAGSRGIINAASRSEIRNLSVRNTWSDSSALGVLVESTTGSLISNVRTVASGSAMNTGAWKYGMSIRNSNNVRLVHVSARGRSSDPTLCQGIAVSRSSVTINDSRAVGKSDSCTISLGLNAGDGSQVQVSNSVLRGEGSLNGISVSGVSDIAGSDTTVRIRHSVLEGQVFAGTPGEAGMTQVLISHSELTGPVSGAATCFGSHDPILNPLNASCIP